MLTKSQVNHIKQLSNKNYRDGCNQFIIEGEKLVSEAVASGWEILRCYALKEWMEAWNKRSKKKIDCIEISQQDLTRISSWQTPQPVLAIIQKKETTSQKPSSVHLVLDSIQDPGNMGTIIRIADWFGISSLYVNQHCADKFNSKVIQASMGSVFRVECFTVDLLSLLEENKEIESYAATLHGSALHSFQKITQGFIVLGNESKGVNPALIERCTHQVTIPRLGSAESLNVGVAAGIICHGLLS